MPKCNVTENASLHAKIRFHDIIRDGVTYYEVKDFDTSFTYGDKVTFVLTNLFEGNAELSKYDISIQIL